MDTRRLRDIQIIAGVNEHLVLIRAGIFSAARDHQSPACDISSHLETDTRENCHEALKRRRLFSSVACDQEDILPGGHLVYPGSGSQMVLESTGSFVISSMFTNCPANRWEASLTPYSLILSLLFVEIGCRAQLSASEADARAIAHCHITWLRKKRVKKETNKKCFMTSWYLIFYPECVRISGQQGLAPWPGEICEFVTQYALYVIKNFILYAGRGPPAGNSSNAAFFSLCCCPFGILWCINILWPMAHRCGHLMVVGFTTNNI